MSYVQTDEDDADIPVPYGTTVFFNHQERKRIARIAHFHGYDCSCHHISGAHHNVGCLAPGCWCGPPCRLRSREQALAWQQEQGLDAVWAKFLGDATDAMGIVTGWPEVTGQLFTLELWHGKSSLRSSCFLHLMTKPEVDDLLYQATIKALST